jgi:hypothetical protein
LPNLDYERAKKLRTIKKGRWEKGVPHHWMSERLIRFLAEHDLNDYGDHFCWKFGGDGDNGETLMYQMDAFFEMLDKLKKSPLRFTTK